jgi:carboxyl-terminal processing protease
MTYLIKYVTNNTILLKLLIRLNIKEISISFLYKMIRSLATILIILLVSFPAHAEGESIYNFLVGKQKLDYKLLFDEVIKKVKNEYVEETTDKQLMEAALEGMLSSLDPHSTFLNEKDYQDMRISTKGEFGGLGIEVTMERGFIKVISPYEDSPAFKAGIKIGDFITMIDGQIVKGLTLPQAVEKLRGKPKTKVKVTIYRESSNETIELTLSREIIKIVPVKAKIIGEDVAHLKLSSFSENSSQLLRKEFMRLEDQAKESGKLLRGIVLDLRWNPGGLLDQSKEVTELFLEDGIIVSTKGRIPESNNIFRANGKDISNGLPIVLLINGGSASASEIVAGALQDNKRALIAGTKSFGKGSVQTVMPLPGNTAMKITTSRYFTPSGRSIQAEGIEPDVVIEEGVVTATKSNEFMGSEASLVGHLEGDDEKAQEGKKPQQRHIGSVSGGKKAAGDDFQLLRAVDLVKGMALYSERLTN